MVYLKVNVACCFNILWFCEDGKRRKVSFFPVSCKPEPEVTWYYGQEKQSSTDRYRIHRQRGGVHVFQIRDLKPSDAGEWRSLAFNSYGQTLCSCTIKVIGTLMFLLEVDFVLNNESWSCISKFNPSNGWAVQILKSSLQVDHTWNSNWKVLLKYLN